MSRIQIADILRTADRAFVESEHIVGDGLVLDVVESSTLTAYDAEFVALAGALSVPLVTADKVVLKAFPDRALTMEAFIDR
jgi:predicted nucleic acid-binding protein